MRIGAIDSTRTRSRPAMLSVIACLAAVAPSSGSAQTGDGIYGRFDSSTAIVFGAGATVATSSGDVAGLLDARIRIFDAAGLATSFTIAPDTRTTMFAGIELRPLFPGLFLKSMDTRRRFLDLFVQSIGVELGAEMALASSAPIGFVWGLSFEVPIVSPDRFAHGVGLRLGMRHTAYVGDSRPNPATDESIYQLYALLAVGFDAGSGVADWEPIRHRHR